VYKDKKDDSFGSAKRGGHHGRGRGREHRYGRGRGNYEGANEDQKPCNFDKSKVKCFNYNEYGHFAKEYPKPNRRERANLATTQAEDEHALLMAETCVLNHAIQNEHVLLREDKMWYLDTGASSHITSYIDKFTEIDMTIKGSVKFEDGSTMDIQGRSSVLFECLNGEHGLLTNIYYISMLRSSIISLCQLDQNGCKIIIEGGVMTILDRTQRLLEKVSRSRYGHVNFHALKMLSQK
jgi:hypothetical protein